MRPSIRFEVFKRDGFTCQYCGRKTPDVVLEVDHIIPRVEGGTDDLLNLTTACWDCNRGKGAKLLDDRAPVPDIGSMTEALREREMQIRAFREVQQEISARQDGEYEAAEAYWFELQGNPDSLPHYYLPTKSAVKRYLDQLGPAEVRDAMDIAFDHKPYGNTKTVQYFFGVLKRKLARQEGRIVPCKYCAKDIVIDPGEDTTCEWWHVACEPADG